jgi:hypothetical protein
MFRVYCECAKTSIGYAAIMSDKTVVKVLPYVMRSVNELNIPPGNTQGYEILYFGVNLILMFDYRLSFNIELLRLSCPFITNWWLKRIAKINWKWKY